MPRQIFVNLAVTDLERSKTFWRAVGYDFNPMFSDETAACMVISDTIFAMIMTHEKFVTFTPKKVADVKGAQEVLIALSADSREDVDRIVNAALKAGATVAKEDQDYGWMYIRTFLDLDGHHWEYAFMDQSKLPQQ